MSKYLGLFVSEAGEHLKALGNDLVQLERICTSADTGEPRGPVVDSLFRHAHSVKGMAASMGFDAIVEVAHRLEDLADLMRRRPEEIGGPAIDVLFEASDALLAMVQSCASGKGPPSAPELLERLSKAVAEWRSPGARATEPAVLPAQQQALPVAMPEETSPAAAPGERRGSASREPEGAGVAASAASNPRRSLEVEVEVVGTCPVPGVRGFLVVKKLGGAGTVAATTPSVDDLKAGRIPDRKLLVRLDSSEPVAAIEKLLGQVSDLSRVVVRELAAGAAPMAPPPQPAAAATAPPVPTPGTVESGVALAVPEGVRTVRVRTELLDYFLDTVGELILSTARLREVGKTLPENHRPPLDEGVDRLHAIVKDLHDKVMAVRMTPLALVTDRLPRAARDLARKMGKQIEVEVRGGNIELDRAIIEELGDPLLHVLRNAIDHGVEPPHLRQLAGKAPAGRIAIHARRERDRVLVEVADDGRGIDPHKLRSAAVFRGAVTAEQAAALSDKEALLLCCLPGVSTAETITDVSGRGVGMDAVKRAVELVGGTLEIDSVIGLGTRFTFHLPLTVAVQQVLLVKVGDEVLGLPIAKVSGAAEVDIATLTTSRGAPLLPYDGALVPVHSLAHLLGFPETEGARSRSMVVVEGEGGRVALAVDALLGQDEAVLKPLSKPFDLVSGLSAVTVLGNGRPVFILDVPRLLAA
jgi:two-component system chemotaxis sensor kinase CheA